MSIASSSEAEPNARPRRAGSRAAARRRTAVTAATLLSGAALAACSSGPSGHQVPSDWIHQNYYVSNSYGYDLDPKDPPAKVADEINKHSSAKDRLEDSGMVFLRYRNDIVAVSPYEKGSKIEIDSYNSGYHHWNSYIRNRWPIPDTDGGAFRGGGPGSGK
jgi:hypothetical protein